MTQQTNLDTLLEKPANQRPGLREDYQGSDQGLTSLIDEDDEIDDDDDLDEDDLDVDEIDVVETDDIEPDVVPADDDLDEDLPLDDDDDDDDDDV